MLVTLSASVPLLFQTIAASLCAVNYDSQANVCWQMNPSPVAPDKVDVQMLDINAGEYLDSHWITPTTMLSIIRNQDGCYMWLDDQWNTTTTCQ